MYRSSHRYKVTSLLLLYTLIVFGQDKPKIIEAVNLNIGFTMFKNQYLDKRLNNHFSYLAKAFNLGLEFYNKPLNMSFDVRKTYWIGLTASSYSTDVSATATYNQIGVTKYFDCNNNKTKIGINLSHIWIAEYSTFFGLGNASVQYAYFQVKPYWTSKSISFAGSVNLTKHLYTELKFNYYYFISDYYKINNFSVPKKGINDNRIQVSLIYKINKG